MHELSPILNRLTTKKPAATAEKNQPGSSFFKPVVQPKLTVNNPNDVYEQEADAMAEKVMRKPVEGEKQNTFFKPPVSFIQREDDATKTLTEGLGVVKEQLEEKPGFDEWKDEQTDALKKKVWDDQPTELKAGIIGFGLSSVGILGTVFATDPRFRASTIDLLNDKNLALPLSLIPHHEYFPLSSFKYKLPSAEGAPVTFDTEFEFKPYLDLMRERWTFIPKTDLSLGVSTNYSDAGGFNFSGGFIKLKFGGGIINLQGFYNQPLPATPMLISGNNPGESPAWIMRTLPGQFEDQLPKGSGVFISIDIARLPQLWNGEERKPGIQRKCAACEEEEKAINRKESNAASSPDVSPSVEQTLQSSGRPLDTDTKGFMEEKFGYDFSNVQIHNDATANRSSADINALAYTHNNHIVFGEGQYQPQTDSGKRLLAHELTHVVQQGAALNDVQRSCGAEQIGTPSGCTENSMNVPERPRYLFRVSCDEFLEGNELDLRMDALNIQDGEQIEIHGLASEEGTFEFNRHLSCARALAAERVIEEVLTSRGISANISVFSHGPQAGGRDVNRSVAIIRHENPFPQPEPEEPEPQPSTPPTCSGIYSDGHDETSDSDHDLDKAHHSGENSPDVIFYDYIGGESGAMTDFSVGFFGGTMFESTSDDDTLFEHFVSGSGSRLSFTPSMDMATIIGNASAFTTFADDFERAVNNYIAANGTLCGFDGDTYISSHRPAYFHSPLFAWAVMGGYSRIEARVSQTSGGINVRYKIFDHFGAGVSDAWSYLLGLSAMYYLQHFHGSWGTAYTPFIWSVEIERTSP